MKNGVKILIIVAIVAVVAAIVVYFFVFKKSDKPNEKKQEGADLYEVTTESTDLNVRKEANANSEKIGSLAKGSIVNVSTIDNGFGYLPTYQGWASMQYLTKKQ